MRVLNVSVLLSLLILISCGNEPSKKKSHIESGQNAICAGLNCLSSVNWKILIAGQNYPTKSKIAINDQVVVNECIGGKGFVKIDRSADPMTVTLKKFFVPKEHVKILVTDLGDCNQEDEYFANNEVPFEIVKTEAAEEIVIHL